MYRNDTAIASLIRNLTNFRGTAAPRCQEIASRLPGPLDMADMGLALVVLGKAYSSDIPTGKEELERLFREKCNLTLEPMPIPSAPPPPSPMPKPSASQRLGDAILGVLSDQITSISEQVSQAVTKKELSEFAETISDTIAALSAQAKRPGVTIAVNSCPAINVDGYLHPVFPIVLAACANRVNLMLVGPAGTGKTSLGKLVGKSLGIERVVAQSFCAQTPESRLFGYTDANSNYCRTKFRDCYEFGGIYILDEIDSASPNVLTALNAAIDNGSCTFPDKVVSRHDDCIIIACANTYGNGADRQYVGRQQLDSATLNRFAKLHVPYDPSLDLAVAGLPYTPSLTTLTPCDPSTVAARWCNVVLACRALVLQHGIRTIVSPRQTRDGVRLLASGIPFQNVLEMLILSGLSDVDQNKLTETAKTAWGV